MKILLKKKKAKKKKKLVYFNMFSKHMSRDARKPDNCLCENKGADQLRGNREADQRLCFRYSDSTIPPLLNSKISSFKLLSVTVQVGLCQTWSETPKTGFLASRLICYCTADQRLCFCYPDSTIPLLLIIKISSI